MTIIGRNLHKFIYLVIDIMPGPSFLPHLLFKYISSIIFKCHTRLVINPLPYKSQICLSQINYTYLKK